MERVPAPSTTERLVQAARALSDRVETLRFSPPVVCVYNPLRYAWQAHEQYLRRFATGPKRVLFLGMNPGPFGMTQTGIPFGEVRAVRDWIGVKAPIAPPSRQHPKRPILGFDCARSEISGQRLWKLFAARFRTPEAFFADHFVVNYCPLAFVEESGCNRTPDKLPMSERTPLFAACDAHLTCVLEALTPSWVVGIGNFSAVRAKHACQPLGIQVGQILHPSPASPAANRNWEKTVVSELVRLGIWR
jgi:single-strand selective monofunctional uracil DNA glycosylase